MGILDITEKTFNVINDDLYNFGMVHHVRSCNGRQVRVAQEIVLGRIRNSHSLEPGYIRGLIESWFSSDDFYTMITTWPSDPFKVMEIELRRRETMSQGALFGPAGTVFIIEVNKKIQKINS